MSSALEIRSMARGDMKRSATSGESAPLGATPSPGGVNFSLFSRHASEVELLLFDREDSAAPTHVVRLDPRCNRTYYYWHVAVPGVKPRKVKSARCRIKRVSAPACEPGQLMSTASSARPTATAATASPA